MVNSGREAGASIEHPHGQLLSMSFVPGEIADELAGFARFQGNCLLCTVAAGRGGRRSPRGVLRQRVVVVCPFWSGTPYQMLVLPRDHNPHLHRAGPGRLAAVGRAIRVSLAAMRARLGDLPYNVLFHSAPFRVRGDYHWHAHILPKVTTRGGFELGSGVLINVMAPERAAEELQGRSQGAGVSRAPPPFPP